MLSDDESVRPEISRGAETAISLDGEFDLSNASALREQLAAAIATEADRIIIDMSGVTFMDSSGLAELVVARNNLAPNRIIEIRHLQPSVRKVFDLTGLSGIFGHDA